MAQLEGKKIAILIEQTYEDLEAWYPYLRLKEAGAETFFVASEKKEYTGKHGYPVIPQFSIDQVSNREFDAIVIPGGFAPDYMRRVPAMVELVKRIYDEKKVVAAICHGGWMLVSAGILKGKTATSFFAIKDDMVNAGAEWVDEEVVRDGNVITSRKPEDLPIFCRTIIETLVPKE